MTIEFYTEAEIDKLVEFVKGSKCLTGSRYHDVYQLSLAQLQVILAKVQLETKPV
jgi:hypothetical protein